jgi:hypothetical protein
VGSSGDTENTVLKWYVIHDGYDRGRVRSSIRLVVEGMVIDCVYIVD